MSRPSTEIIEKYEIINQFRRYETVQAKLYSKFGDEHIDVFMPYSLASLKERH